MFKVPESSRIRSGRLASTPQDGNNGAFTLKSAKLKRHIFCIASDGMGWEHVSVSFPDRCPTWEEMCFVKNQFWGEDDLVVQLHPPKSEYIDNHKFCLHLWRKAGTNEFCETPPSIMVGLKGVA